MALTKCKECDHEVSTAAEKCPNCGTSDFLSDDAKELLREERQREQLKAWVESGGTAKLPLAKKKKKGKKTPEVQPVVISTREGAEHSVSKGLGLGCGIGIGLVVGIIAAVIIIPIIGISMCGYTATKIAEFSENAENHGKTEAQKQATIEPEKLAYMSKVKLTGIRISETVLGDKGVFGEVKNTGDKPLKEVEIIIYGLDRSGKRVFEEKHSPVYTGGWLSDDDDILRPNYSEKFGYKLDNMPSTWSGKVDVKITDIEFYESN